MNHMSPVVVKKMGFFPALFLGLFGTIIASVVCAAGLGFYGLNIVDSKAGDVLALGQGLIRGLPEFQEALPPALADLLDDKRDPQYRRNIDLQARIVPDRNRDDRGRAVITVTNNGDETVSLMSLRVVLEDDRQVPIREMVTYAATPVTIDDQWRGPLLPGSTRKFSVCTWRGSGELDVSAEVTDLRVWNRDADVGSSDGDTDLRMTNAWNQD